MGSDNLNPNSKWLVQTQWAFRHGQCHPLKGGTAICFLSPEWKPSQKSLVRGKVRTCWYQRMPVASRKSMYLCWD